jgi:hypothetical protein
MLSGRVGESLGQENTLSCIVPCPNKHKETVHISPSNPNYFKEKRAHLRRTTCWRENVS